jgi:hypothetical protein
MDSTLAYLSPLAVAKLKGSVTAAFIHDVRSISHTYLTAKDAGRRPLEQRLRRVFSLSLIKRFIDIPLSPYTRYSPVDKDVRWDRSMRRPSWRRPIYVQAH